MPKRQRSRSIVHRQAMPEVKFHDDAVTVSVAAGNQQVQLVGDLIAQDATVSGRIGSKIAIDQVALKFRLSTATETGVAAEMVDVYARVVLLVDTQANGVTDPVWVDVFDQTAGSDGLNGLRAMNATSRFRILYDRIHVIRRESGTYGANTVNLSFSGPKFFNLYKKFKKPLVRKYASGNTTGASTAIEKNAIWLMIAGDVANGGDLTGNCQVRTRYYDY